MRRAFWLAAVPALCGCHLAFSYTVDDGDGGGVSAAPRDRAAEPRVDAADGRAAERDLAEERAPADAVADRASGDGAPRDAAARDAAAADAAADAPPLDAAALDLPAPDIDPCPHPVVVQSCTAAGWCTIPAGCFLMGSPAGESCRSANEDLHQVTLTHDYLINAAEVARWEFAARMGYDPAGCKKCGTQHPVEMVSWHEAAAYCNALSQAEGRETCYECSGALSAVSCAAKPSYADQALYDCPGYRLPTEAEWEYAIRAGTSGAYYTGADSTVCDKKLDPAADAIGWYFYNAGLYPEIGKQKLPNGWGLYDMAGNVGEWTNDHYAMNLGTAAVVDPVGPAAGAEHTARGGSFFEPAASLRSASRGYYAGPGMNVGFRCARRAP